MRRIPENVIDNIRSKSDIVDTISSYITLTKKGKNYWGVCPFHDDSNPSLSVSSERQIYKCFVCGAGGNVFTFTEKFEKIGFIDAVVKQAQRVHVDLSDYATQIVRPVDQKKERLLSLMQEVKDFTEYQLTTKEGHTALEILNKRGYSVEILKRFGVGVALSDNKIFNFLKAKGYSEDEMLQVDIIRYTQDTVQDVFYNRIMFPIFDQFGRVVAFSARALNNDNNVKYINTSQTPLYTKGDHLYNLNNAKEATRKAGLLVITEGVTDAIAFTMADIPNVVSLLGVACTEAQIRLIKSTTKEVLLAFDGDKAGLDATYAIGKRLHESQFKVSIWYNDSGLDPDELLKRSGKDKVVFGVENRLGWYDFLLSYAVGKYGLESFENKKRVITFFLPSILNEDDITVSYYLKQLSDKTDFDIEALRSQYSQLLGSKVQREVITTPAFISKKRNKFNASHPEYEILKQMVLSKEAAYLYRDKLGFLPDQFAYDFALLLLEVYRKKDTIEIADLISMTISDTLKDFILEFENRLGVDTYNEAILLQNIELIQTRVQKDNVRQKRKQIKEIHDFDEQMRILEEIVNAKRKL